MAYSVGNAVREVKKQTDNSATAFICVGKTCSLPITDANAFSASLKESI